MPGGSCVGCGKEFKGKQVYSSIIYDKCRGKLCPDCGKMRKLGVIETVDFGKVYSWGCLRCGEMKSIFVRRPENKKEGVCVKCFLEREGKDGCICYHTKGIHFCSICDEVHAQPRLCEGCMEKKTLSYQRKQTFLKVVLPTAVISLVLGLFLG